MREFHIGKNDENQRLDRFLGKAIPLLPASLAQKYIRLKRIKVNGARAQRDQKLVAGDILQCYINDEFFESPSEENVYLTITTPRLKIVYENIMLLDKPAGMLAHADEHEKVNTLVNHMLAYLYQKREWRPREENAFTPALCNRIDRNTGGIVVAAKNAEALRILNDKIKEHELKKKYVCVVLGRPEPPRGRIENFLRRDEKRKQVTLHDRPVPGAKTAKTIYRTLASTKELSLVECTLLTGRTHQIRAQFAAAGHPLLGDGKYGRERDNKKYGRSFQALYSYKLAFTFPTDAGLLEYLRGRVSTVEQVDFVAEYFPTGERV